MKNDLIIVAVSSGFIGFAIGAFTIHASYSKALIAGWMEISRLNGELIRAKEKSNEPL